MYIHNSSRICLDYTCILEFQFCHEWLMWEIYIERGSKWIGKSHFLFEAWKWQNAYWRTCAMAGEDIVDAKYNMTQLVDLAWTKEFYLG